MPVRRELHHGRPDGDETRRVSHRGQYLCQNGTICWLTNHFLTPNITKPGASGGDDNEPSECASIHDRCRSWVGSPGGWEGGVVAPSSPFDSDWIQQVQTLAEPMDASRLKRVGVVTYFGVYALIAVGGWRVLVGLWQLLPPVIRPPALPPLHVLFGLPRSVAWALVSLSIALVAVGAVAGYRVSRARAGESASLNELGGSSRLDRLRPSVGRSPLSLPDVPWVSDEPSATEADTLPVVDGSLVAPADPLSLPRREVSSAPESDQRPAVSPLGSVVEGPGVDVVDAAVLVIDEAVETEVAELIDGPIDETMGGRTDGGKDFPDPEAPWPAEADEGPEGDSPEADAPDADAPWPDDWIPGDEL